MLDQITLLTSEGRIIAKVYRDRAPITARNFLRYVDAGLYREATFYRAAHPGNDTRSPPIRIVQGGIDPSCSCGPLPPIAHESTAVTGLSHVDGALSMVRWAPGTASSEFFISVGDQPELNCGGARMPDGEGFAVFGRVVEGMEIVRRIHASETSAAPAIEALKNQILAKPVAVDIARAGPRAAKRL